MRTSKLKVINLYGPPGVGKSGTRGGLFWLMKSNHLSVEEAPEFAKELLLNGTAWPLQEEQMRLFTEQNHRLHICSRSGYDFAVSDSPLHLSEFYASEDYHPATLGPLIDEAYRKYENYNFFLTRDVVSPDAIYEARGRVHSRDMNTILEHRMRNFLRKKGIPFTELPIDYRTPWAILNKVVPELRPVPPEPM